jgi:hypothetical protein
VVEAWQSGYGMEVTGEVERTSVQVQVVSLVSPERSMFDRS